MAVEFSEAYAVVGFIGTIAMAVVVAIAAGYRTAHWLLEKFTDLVDEHQKDLKDDIATVKQTLDEVGIAVKSVETVQNQHAERIAWLEGQSGQPLGSVVRERTHQ